MQQFSTCTAPSLLYDDGFFGRSELNFGQDHPDCLSEPAISSGLLGLVDTLGGIDTGSSFVGMGEIPSHNSGGSDISSQVGSTHDMHHLTMSMGLDDSSQFLHDMLNNQQQLHQHIGQSSHNGNGSMTLSQDENISGQPSAAASAWEDSIHVLQEMLMQQQQQQMQVQEQNLIYNNGLRGSSGMTYGVEPIRDRLPVYGGAGYAMMNKAPPESELLSLLQLPRCATNSLQGSAGSVSSYPASHSFKKFGPVNSCNIPGLYNSGELDGPRNRVGHMAAAPFQFSSPALGNFFPPMTNSLRTESSLLKQGSQHSIISRGGSSDYDRDTEDSAAPRLPSFLEMANCKRGGAGETSTLGGKAGPESRGVNHFATERQRREYLNEKYQTLRSLVPNPSKADRASIVADAIDYVQELKRTVQELQLLVQERRRSQSLGSSRAKRRRSGDGPSDVGCLNSADNENCNDQLQQTQFCEASPIADGLHLRSAFLQRTSQSGTHIDVRIIHDEVTIKVQQRKRKGCLLQVMRTLYELQLDLQHGSGSTIGEHDIYIFNSKVTEGVSIFANRIAEKLIDAIDERNPM